MARDRKKILIPNLHMEAICKKDTNLRTIDGQVSVWKRDCVYVAKLRSGSDEVEIKNSIDWVPILKMSQFHRFFKVM